MRLALPWLLEPEVLVPVLETDEPDLLDLEPLFSDLEDPVRLMALDPDADLPDLTPLFPDFELDRPDLEPDEPDLPDLEPLFSDLKLDPDRLPTVDPDLLADLEPVDPDLVPVLELMDSDLLTDLVPIDLDLTVDLPPSEDSSSERRELALVVLERELFLPPELVPLDDLPELREVDDLVAIVPSFSKKIKAVLGLIEFE